MGCDQVDLLILNAAIMLQPGFGFFPYRQDILGQSIVERHLAINVLANAQIFASLTPRMECSNLKNPRAIFVSSSVAHAGEISLLLKDEGSFFLDFKKH
jgi:NAD(P)-dependent dehydrogenase (short-subunit alcohol dehydrogenase family)